MTIIAASLRPTFATIVVERLWHDPTSGETGFDPKLVVHPQLPLVIATAGFREMPDGRLVTDHLKDLVGAVADALPSADALWASVAEHFVEPVRELRQHFGTGPSAHLDFYIGLFRDGAAHMRVMRIDNDPAPRPGPVWLDGPEHIGTFWKKRGMLKGKYIYGQPEWNEAKVVDHLSSIVRVGIEHDAFTGVPHRYAGGTVDVAIVRADGVEHRELTQSAWTDLLQVVGNLRRAWARARH